VNTDNKKIEEQRQYGSFNTPAVSYSAMNTRPFSISFVPSSLNPMQITVMVRINMTEASTASSNSVIYDMASTTATYSF
jgi:hypothetical protein